MSTSLAIIAALKDENLSERIEAVMTELNVKDPDYESQRNRRTIVITEIPVEEAQEQLEEGVEARLADTTNLADVREQAEKARAEAIEARSAAIAEAEAEHPIPPDPGLDTDAVTDDHIRAAVQALIDQQVLPTK